MGATARFPRNQKGVPSARGAAGFSLLELLVVMMILVLMATLIGPAISGIGGGQNMTKSVYDVAGLLEQARSHAMAKNTYVYVALAEATENITDVKLAPAGGRLVVAVVASKTGVRPVSMAATDGSLVPVSPLKKFENIKMEAVGAEGNLENRKTGADVVILSDAATSDFAGLTWNAGGKTLTFQKVIEFDPSGVARFTDKDNIDGWIEIPLKPAHSSKDNVAAVQLDGETGSVQVYRP